MRLPGALLGLIACGSGIVSAPALASGLLGSSFGWQYYGGGGPYNPGNGSVTSGIFTDNGGIGGTFIDQGGIDIFDIIADDNSITFSYAPDQSVGPWSNSPESLAPTIFNGIAINLLSSGSFTSVTIDPATNMAGFGASDFSFTSNQIEVNWADLPYNASTVVTLDVNSPSSSTPEPATGNLMVVATLIIATFMSLRRFVR
jgi:hypothetical protein